ncbi:hypothetical protein MNBD_GAMMA26-348 [hydrothermal vent metagenome]|uniref:Polymerase nucleotidyl transferase domain-containing protein n=1 Tax=hydrothermal vent metagenome TaxID=652676 RepID=A0A3B1BGI5_9ZZZZ
MSKTNLHLLPGELAQVRRILRAFVPEQRVFIFGSRATGNQLKPHSDLDVLIQVEIPLPLRQKRQLTEAFDESSLPFKVDVLESTELDSSFLQAVTQEALPI